MLVDTHCHIHEIVEHTTPVHDKWHEKGIVDVEAVLASARLVGVNKLICVGTTLADSQLAIKFVNTHENTWASIGIHPHESKDHLEKATLEQFATLTGSPKVVAVGECGLDYFYTHSTKENQATLLKMQIELAIAANLPMIFHVREAFDDFWAIFEQYKGIRGVLHSYTDNLANMERAVAHGLYIGVNGISTFTTSEAQLAMYAAIPLPHLLLETDAPFLTPRPYRGTMCEPKHVRTTAEFLADLRGESFQDLARQTTVNAKELFGV